MKLLKKDRIDHLVLKLIKRLGNDQPNKEQVELLKSLLSTTEVLHRLSFDNQLTSREVACLYLAANGKTSEQSAKVLGVTKATIESFRKRIIQKLDCDNLTQAVFKGIRVGCLAQKRIYEDYIDFADL